jgi:hypothetical protein
MRSGSSMRPIRRYSANTLCVYPMLTRAASATASILGGRTVCGSSNRLYCSNTSAFFSKYRSVVHSRSVRRFDSASTVMSCTHSPSDGCGSLLCCLLNSDVSEINTKVHCRLLFCCCCCESRLCYGLQGPAGHRTISTRFEPCSVLCPRIFSFFFCPCLQNQTWTNQKKSFHGRNGLIIRTIISNLVVLATIDRSDLISSLVVRLVGFGGFGGGIGGKYVESTHTRSL